jgi:hypothetical protein
MLIGPPVLISFRAFTVLSEANLIPDHGLFSFPGRRGRTWSHPMGTLLALVGIVLMTIVVAFDLSKAAG